MLTDIAGQSRRRLSLRSPSPAVAPPRSPAGSRSVLGLLFVLVSAPVAAAADSPPPPTALTEVDRRANHRTTTDDDAVDVAHLRHRPLDADTAVRIAVGNNRRLRARLQQLGVHDGLLAQAGTIANPTFEIESLPERNSSFELRLEYNITSLLLAPLKRSVATSEREAARYSVAAELLQLAYETRAAFYAVQAAERRFHIARELLETLAVGKATAVAMEEAGNVPALNVARELAAYEQTRVAVARLELELHQRREILQRTLGLHGESTAWAVTPNLPRVVDDLPSSITYESRALEVSLERAALQHRMEGVARQTRLTAVEAWLPEVVLDLHSLSGNPDEGDHARNWRFGGGVSLHLPIFDRRTGEQRANEAEFDSLRHEYHALAVEIRSTARDARNQVASAHARTRHYRQVIVPAQRRVLEETLRQYNAMQVGIFSLLEARRDLLEIELEEIDVQREFWTAMAAAETLLAGKRVSGATSPLPEPIARTIETGGH